jgi:NAD(P)-dependent dehydrogenase (short-subunit alcohol dehydrogenase family)
LEEGAKVIAADIRADDLAQWDDVQDVIPIVANVNNLDDIKAMVAAAVDNFGKLTTVCNIAGMNDLSYPLLETDDERWDKVLDLDLKAPFRICREAIPVMIEGGGGAIVNIGSYAALRGNHGPSYTAAKAGLVGLTKSIAFGYIDQGIRCNIIHPGGMRTQIGEHSGGNYHPAGARLSKLVQAMPVFCYGDPVEIAKACLFLASDDAAYITGAELSVDLGMAVC